MKETDSKTHTENHYQPKYYEKNNSEPLFTLEPDSIRQNFNTGRSSVGRRASKIVVPENIPLTDLLELHQSEDEIS